MDSYRKEQRAQELKKQHKQRRQQKESRLEGLDPLKIHWRLTQLQQKYANSGFKKVYIPHHEQKQISRLEQDLADLKRSQNISEEAWKEMLEGQKKRETRFKRFKHGLGEVSDYNSPPQGQQRESIFWDPVFNHRGVSPRGFPYLSKDVLRKRVDKDDKDDVEYSSDEEVRGIALPTETPSWKKDKEEQVADKSEVADKAEPVQEQKSQPKREIPVAKEVYESGPQVRNLAAEAARFVPRQVQLKKKKEQKEASHVTETKEEAGHVTEKKHPMLEEVEEEEATSIHVERVAEEKQPEQQQPEQDEIEVDVAVTTEPEPEPESVVEAPVEPSPEPVTGHKLLIGQTAEAEIEEEESEDDDDDALY